MFLSIESIALRTRKMAVVFFATISCSPFALLCASNSWADQVVSNNQNLQISLKHAGFIIDYSINASFLVSVGDDGKIKLWDRHSLSLIRSYDAPKDTQQAEWIDKHHVVLSQRGESVWLLDLVSGEAHIVYSRPGARLGIDSLGDQRVVIRGGDAPVCVVTLDEKGFRILPKLTEQIPPGARIISSDGIRVIYLDKNPYMIDGSDGPRLVDLNTSNGHKQEVTQFSDQIQAWTGSIKGGFVYLLTHDREFVAYNTKSRKLIISKLGVNTHDIAANGLGEVSALEIIGGRTTISILDKVGSVGKVFNPDQSEGKMIFSGPDLYYLSSSGSFTEIDTAAGKMSNVRQNIFTEERAQPGDIASPEFPKAEFDSPVSGPNFSSKRLSDLAHDEGKSLICFSSTGKYALIGDAGYRNIGAELYDVSTGNLVYKDIYMVSKACAFTHDDHYFFGYSLDHNVIFDDYGIRSLTRDGRTFYPFLINLDDTKKLILPFNIQPLAYKFSPSGNLLAFSSTDRSIRLWDLKKSSLKAEWRGDAFYSSLTFSPDETVLGIRSVDLNVLLWHLDTKDPISVQPTGYPAGGEIGFSASGKLLYTTQPMRQIWDTATGRFIVAERSFGVDDWVVFGPGDEFDASAAGFSRVRAVKGLTTAIVTSRDANYRPGLLRRRLAPSLKVPSP